MVAEPSSAKFTIGSYANATHDASNWNFACANNRAVRFSRRARFEFRLYINICEYGFVNGIALNTATIPITDVLVANIEDTSN